MSSFRFGKNWQHFTRSYLNQERIAMAKESLQEFLGVQDLKGKTFADVGAGSGVYSLAAHQLGASDVLSFDVDPDCIECCNFCKQHAGSPANWHVIRGSAIDDAFMATMKQYDIVYSWGVLHHTGNMWKAIENAMRVVKPGGVFFLAIYNRADGFAFYPDGRFGPSGFWKWEKKLYVSLPSFLQNVIDYIVMGLLIVLYTITLHNPIRIIREHNNYFNKGMPWRIMIKDWLGGYPYEYATVEEIFHFAKDRGFTLENLTCNNGLLNNEFLLRKTAS